MPETLLDFLRFELKCHSAPVAGSSYGRKNPCEINNSPTDGQVKVIFGRVSATIVVQMDVLDSIRVSFQKTIAAILIRKKLCMPEIQSHLQQRHR